MNAIVHPSPEIPEIAGRSRLVLRIPCMRMAGACPLDHHQSNGIDAY
jgi:hypothetical protein